MDQEIQNVKAGKSLRGTGDNTDIIVLSSSMREDVGNQSWHLFSSNLIVNRIQFHHLPNEFPKLKVKDCSPSTMLCNKNDIMKYKNSIKIIIAREVLQFLPKLKFLSSLVTDHILHQYSQEIKQQSTIIPMSILEANQNNYQDCVMILRAYEKWIREIYHNAGMLGIFIYIYKHTHKIFII